MPHRAPRVFGVAFEAARVVVDKTQGAVCYHTVLAGDDDTGRAFLASLSQVTSCGSFRTSSSIDRSSSLASFQREVFVAPALPVVAAPRPVIFRSMTLSPCSNSRPCSPADRQHFRAAKDSVSQSAVRCSVSRLCCCSTSRCRRSM